MLDSMESALLGLDLPGASATGDKMPEETTEAINTIFRGAHSIKGRRRHVRVQRHRRLHARHGDAARPGARGNQEDRARGRGPAAAIRRLPARHDVRAAKRRRPRTQRVRAISRASWKRRWTRRVAGRRSSVLRQDRRPTTGDRQLGTRRERSPMRNSTICWNNCTARVEPRGQAVSRQSIVVSQDRRPTTRDRRLIVPNGASSSARGPDFSKPATTRCARSARWRHSRR